jgi:hypothetical protein
MHGKGVMNYANQDSYDGEWKEGCKDGQGTMKYHYGDVYEGRFSNDKMHGKGTFEYADGSGEVMKSIGEWKEGKKFGLFEDVVIVRVSKQVYYENDEPKANSNAITSSKIEDFIDKFMDPISPSLQRLLLFFLMTYCFITEMFSIFS